MIPLYHIMVKRDIDGEEFYVFVLCVLYRWQWVVD